MKQHTIIFAITFLVLLATPSSLSYAQNITDKESPKAGNQVFRQNSLQPNSTQEGQAVPPTTQQNREEKVLTPMKTRAEKMTDSRIGQLNKLLTLIEDNKKLSQNDKTTLAADVKNVIDGINALKAKIQSDTTIADVKADTKQIITNYKVYVVLIPKVRLLITIANLTALSAKMNEDAIRFQNLIDTQKAQGQDITTIQSFLIDIMTLSQGINAKLETAKATVFAVSVASTNPQATFTQVRKDLSLVRADFAKTRKHIAQMRDLFKNSIKDTVSPTKTSTVLPGQ